MQNFRGIRFFTRNAAFITYKTQTYPGNQPGTRTETQVDPGRVLGNMATNTQITRDNDPTRHHTRNLPGFTTIDGPLLHGYSD